MRGIMVLGIALICIGVAALAFGQFSYTETKPLIKAGPIQVNTQEEHYVSIPTIAGIIIMVAGIGFVFVGSKRS